MSDWNDVLQDIKRRYPFLTRMNVCGAEHYSSPLPGALQASTDIAGKLLDEETDFRLLAMISPLLGLSTGLAPIWMLLPNSEFCPDATKHRAYRA